MRHDDLFIRMRISILNSEKIMSLSAEAYRLWSLSLMISARDLSDGHVRPDVAVVTARSKNRYAGELMRTGIWHEPGHTCESCPQPKPDTIYIHDYLDHQQSREQIEGRQMQRSQAGRKGAEARWKR